MSLQTGSRRLSPPAACSGRSGIEAALSAPLTKCQRPPGPPCVPQDGRYCLSPPQTLLPGLPWPLCQKIPGQAEAICLENKPCAEPPQDGPKGFGLIQKLRAGSRPRQSGGISGCCLKAASLLLCCLPPCSLLPHPLHYPPPRGGEGPEQRAGRRV